MMQDAIMYVAIHDSQRMDIRQWVDDEAINNYLQLVLGKFTDGKKRFWQATSKLYINLYFMIETIFLVNFAHKYKVKPIH